MKIKVKNLRSALEHPGVVDRKLKKELDLGRIAGPFYTEPFRDFRISPIGVVPKKEKGSFRLIHHLSYPEGDSINDGIPQNMSHVTYQHIDHAVEHMRHLGKGCFFAKTDIAEAFRIVPLHPSQYHLFGMEWKGQLFYDKCLPMGCSASCLLFERLSTALHWVANNKLGISCMTHVLDDFLMIAKNHNTCQNHLVSFLSACADIGIPMAQEKTFKPAQVITFLGYELDSLQMEVRLPLDKLDKCQELIITCLRKEKITLKDLQSIIGTLNFACGAVVPGRPFLRRLIDLTIGVSKPFYYIRLTKAVREDLNVWLSFLSQHNGRSVLLPNRWLPSDTIQLFTDAAGSAGYGAVLGPQWFYGQWDQQWQGCNITLLEFYPIVVAVKVWAGDLENKSVLFYTDNEALVTIINSQTSKHPQILALLRDLVLSCLCNNILFQARHVPGKRNALADALSRLQVDKFKALAPHSLPQPTSVPPLPALPS